MSKKTSSKINRRALLTGVAAASVAAAAAKAESSATPTATPASGAGSVAVAQRGSYEKVALKQDFINVAAIQSQLYSIDLRDKAATNKRNLQRVLRLIDLAQNSPEEWNGERRWGSKVDLICMHEFPIQGSQPWTRKELNQIAYE